MEIKIGMENAFEWVRHSFLFYLMHKFGFSPLVIRWIVACVRISWITPLVNGKPLPFFQISRELRQGCPFSPLLYTLIAEALSEKLEVIYERQTVNLLRINIVRGIKSINHSWFADDTILIGGASLTTAFKFRWMLDALISASGSKAKEPNLWKKCKLTAPLAHLQNHAIFM